MENDKTYNKPKMVEDLNKILLLSNGHSLEKESEKQKIFQQIITNESFLKCLYENMADINEFSTLNLTEEIKINLLISEELNNEQQSKIFYLVFASILKQIESAVLGVTFSSFVDDCEHRLNDKKVNLEDKLALQQKVVLYQQYIEEVIETIKKIDFLDQTYKNQMINDLTLKQKDLQKLPIVQQQVITDDTCAKWLDDLIKQPKKELTTTLKKIEPHAEKFQQYLKNNKEFKAKSACFIYTEQERKNNALYEYKLRNIEFGELKTTLNAIEGSKWTFFGCCCGNY